MAKFIDLTGQRFGRLTVIERDTSRTDRVYWWCRCDCGNITSVVARDLRNGKTKSCGRHSKGHLTHGLSHTKIYQKWIGMRMRCFNPNCERYPNYGGRGITVCDEWRNNFQAFYDYVSKLEHFGEDGYTLDRINNDGNYEPGNVRWATDEQQRRNRTDNHYINIDGNQMILMDVARAANVTTRTIYKRLSLGATSDQLMRKCRVDSWVIEIDGKKLTVAEIAQIAGVHKTTITGRIKAGLSGTDLLAPAKK